MYELSYPTMKKLFSFFNRFHYLWLVLAAPFLVFTTPKRSLALLVIPVLWVLYILEGRIENGKLKIENSADSSRSVKDYSGFPITPLNISLLVLTIMLLFSLWATYDINLSLEKISGVVLGLGVFFAIVRESKRPWGWWLSLAAFLGGGLGWATLGFLGMSYQVRFSFLAPLISQIPIIIKDLPGAESGLQHNAVGGTLTWVLPLMICLSWYFLRENIEYITYKIEDWESGKRLVENGWGGLFIWVMRISVWVGTIFVAGVLLLTQSRGSYLALGLITLLALFLLLPGRWRWILLGIVFLSATLIIIYIDQSGGWNVVTASLGLSDESGFSIDTLGFRLELWSRAIYGIQDFPFTGMGMNTYREVVHVLYPLFTISPDFDIAHAHNEFLQAALDLGVPGLIAFISIYIISFWMLVKIWQDPSGEEVSTRASEERISFIVSKDPVLKKVLVLGLGGGLFGHLVFGMTDAITLGAKPGIFYWMLLGLIMGLYQLTEEVKVIEEG